MDIDDQIKALNKAIKARRDRKKKLSESIDIKIEQIKNDKERIVITSVPYQVNKATLNERIVELVRDKKIEGISDIEMNQTEREFVYL